MHQHLLRHQPCEDGTTSEHSGKFPFPLSRVSGTMVLSSAVRKLIVCEELLKCSRYQGPTRQQRHICFMVGNTLLACKK
jgi:hypothetical protein